MVLAEPSQDATIAGITNIPVGQITENKMIAVIRAVR